MYALLEQLFEGDSNRGMDFCARSAPLARLGGKTYELNYVFRLRPSHPFAFSWRVMLFWCSCFLPGWAESSRQ